MKVNLENIGELPLGNNGVVFRIYENDDTLLGKLRIGKATVEWCQGSVAIKNGVKMPLEDLIKFVKNNASK